MIPCTLIQIDIVIWAEDIDIKPHWIQTYTCAPTQMEKPSFARFELTPTQSDDQQAINQQIRVEFLHQRHWLGTIQFAVKFQDLVSV